MPLTHQPPAFSPAAGQPVELARYCISTCQRIVRGQRIDGAVRVSDIPADDPNGRRYVVERGLELDGYAALKALVADYVAQSKLRDEPAVYAPDLR